MAAKFITRRAVPVFAGDLNHMVVIHWAAEQQASSNQRILHVSESLEAGAARAAMHCVIQRELDALHSAGAPTLLKINFVAAP